MADFAKHKDSIESGGSLRLHYFPDIPTTSRSLRVAEKREGHTASGFERIDFASPSGRVDGPVCPVESEGQGDQEANQVTLTPDQLCEIENQAYARGLETGRAAGVASEQQKVHEIKAQLQQVIVDLDTYRRQVLATMEREAVTLAMAVARKVVCHELRLSKDTVKDVIREAFRKTVDFEQIVIRLNPQDRSLLESQDVDLESLLGRVEGVSFETDEAVSIGGCVIQTQTGDIDARIEKQLQVIADAFHTELNRSIEAP